LLDSVRMLATIVVKYPRAEAINMGHKQRVTNALKLIVHNIVLFAF
jgi:hypothetical protein